MGIYEIVEQGPLQPGAHSLVNPEPGAGQLRPPIIVNETQIQAQVHVVFGGKIKVMGLTIIPQGLVVLFATGDQIWVRQVGKTEHQVVVFHFYCIQLFCGGGNGGFQLCHLTENGGDILPGLFQPGDFLGDPVLLGLFGLRLHN